MKTACIVYEGMADRPDESLQQRTPMEAARCSVATQLAVTGQGGLLQTGRKDIARRSEAILGGFLGFPDDVMAGVWRGPLEALAADVDTAGAAWVFRADLITLDGNRLVGASVPGISLKETQELVESIRAAVADLQVRVEAIQPGTAIVIVEDAQVQDIHSVSPYEVEGDDLETAWSGYRRQKWVRRFVEATRPIFADHPVNEVRVDLGENPANALWPWGGGVPLVAGAGASLRAFDGEVLVSNQMLARGFAKYAGIDSVDLADPWVEIDGKRPLFRIAGIVKALHDNDHLIMYVGSRYPGGRYGRSAEKVWAMECLDHMVLAPMHAVWDSMRPCRTVLAVESAVLASSGRRAREPLPVILAGDGVEPDGVGHWDEKCCAQGSLGVLGFAELMDLARREN